MREMAAPVPGPFPNLAANDGDVQQGWPVRIPQPRQAPLISEAHSLTAPVGLPLQAPKLFRGDHARAAEE